MKLTSSSLAAVAAVIVVVVVVLSALRVLDTPGQQRALRLDERRVADLSKVSEGVNLYWTRNQKLPDNLEALTSLGGVDVPVGPETSQPYAYRALTGSSFELCAEFRGENRDSQTISEDPFWKHAGGRQCFTVQAREIKP